MKKILSLILGLVLACGLQAQVANTGHAASVGSTAPDAGGDVVGPASSTNNAFARFSGTTGKLLQDSPDLTYSSPTMSVPDLFNISSAGSIALTAGGSNKSITITPSGTGGVAIGSQPVSGEQVALWTNTTSSGGAGGVLRAGQFYAQYTGSNASCGVDIVVNATGSSSYGHLVGLQAYVKNTGTAATIDHLWAINFQGTHTGSGTITDASAIYWGGWSGSGTYTAKWFLNSSASTDNSWLGGSLGVQGKFVNGTGPSGALTFGTYQGYINGTNPVWEWANGGTTMIYQGAASIMFSGANANDFGIMQNAAARSIILGVNAEKTVNIAKGTVSLASTAVLSLASATEATTGGAGSLTTAGGIYAAKKIITSTDLVVGKTVVLTPSALTYASPTSVDPTLASVFTVTTVNATGSVTFNATTGGTAGQQMTILITNDATSAKTITFGTNFLSTGTLTASAASRHTSITFCSNGTSWFETGRAVMTN